MDLYYYRSCLRAIKINQNFARLVILVLMIISTSVSEKYAKITIIAMKRIKLFPPKNISECNQIYSIDIFVPIKKLGNNCLHNSPGVIKLIGTCIERNYL